MAGKKRTPKATASPKTPKGGRTRTNAEIQRDREFVTELLRENLRPVEIMERINAIRPYRLGLTTIYADINSSMKAVWDSIQKNVNAVRAELIQRHLKAADEAWEAWVQSKNPNLKKEVSKSGKSDTRTKVVEEGSNGDPRFLTLWLQVQARLAFLYGIREEFEVHVKEDGEIDIDRAESYYSRLQGFRHGRN